jgi:hypothetical protein
MKKRISNLSTIALVAMISVFASCKKPDTSAPVITMNGAASQTVSLQGTYSESGATANDNKDGAITPTISGKVNVNHTGTYIITYRATDAAGNIGTATRTVIVVNDVASMSGIYNCSGTTTYTDTITASPIKNKRIGFGKFGNLAGNTKIYVDISGTTVTLDSVFAIQVGTPPKDRSFRGTGSITSPTVFNLNGTETIYGAPPITFNETFTKQ